MSVLPKLAAVHVLHGTLPPWTQRAGVRTCLQTHKMHTHTHTHTERERQTHTHTHKTRNLELQRVVSLLLLQTLITFLPTHGAKLIRKEA